MMTEQWGDWIGRNQVQKDMLGGSLARRWRATFDLDPHGSGTLPQGIHLCLCTPEAAQAALGEDGHPQRDDSPESFFPPVPLPRRMWASSAIHFFSPLSIGQSIERISRIVSITEKSGSTGALAFVDVEHLTKADGELAISEVQTLVYRDALGPDAPLSPPEPGEGKFDLAAWDAHRALTPDPRLLFRFSALTFNTHRIHYDAPYAVEVERYRGLVVHGPLMASLLLQLAARELGENKLTAFTFRAISPAIADEELHLVMRQSDEGYELGAFASDGRQCVKASAIA